MGTPLSSFAFSYSNLVQPFIVSRHTDNTQLDVRKYNFKRSIDYEHILDQVMDEMNIMTMHCLKSNEACRKEYLNDSKKSGQYSKVDFDSNEAKCHDDFMACIDN